MISAFNIILGANHLEISAPRMQAFIDALTENTNPHRRAGILNYILSVNHTQGFQIAAQTA